MDLASNMNVRKPEAPRLERRIHRQEDALRVRARVSAGHRLSESQALIKPRPGLRTCGLRKSTLDMCEDHDDDRATLERCVRLSMRPLASTNPNTRKPARLAIL